MTLIIRRYDDYEFKYEKENDIICISVKHPEDEVFELKRPSEHKSFQEVRNSLLRHETIIIDDGED